MNCIEIDVSDERSVPELNVTQTEFIPWNGPPRIHGWTFAKMDCSQLPGCPKIRVDIAGPPLQIQPPNVASRRIHPSTFHGIGEVERVERDLPKGKNANLLYC